jgi:hypothetical protein
MIIITSCYITHISITKMLTALWTKVGLNDATLLQLENRTMEQQTRGIKQPQS